MQKKHETSRACDRLIQMKHAEFAAIVANRNLVGAAKVIEVKRLAWRKYQTLTLEERLALRTEARDNTHRVRDLSTGRFVRIEGPPQPCAGDASGLMFILFDTLCTRF